MEILIVSDDAGVHEQLGAQLEADDRHVIDCPGPLWGSCIGLAKGECALCNAADVVVLDLHSDAAAYVDRSGRPALVSFYASAGKPTLVLTDEPVATAGAELTGVAALSRFAQAQEIIETLNALTGPAGPAGHDASGLGSSGVGSPA